jgi:hypothetical protein
LVGAPTEIDAVFVVDGPIALSEALQDNGLRELELARRCNIQNTKLPEYRFHVVLGHGNRDVRFERATEGKRFVTHQGVMVVSLLFCSPSGRKMDEFSQVRIQQYCCFRCSMSLNGTFAGT